MGKRKDTPRSDSQLGFDWGRTSEPPRSPAPSTSQVNVIRFVDSSTLAVRKDAIDRVARSGVFSPQPSKR